MHGHSRIHLVQLLLVLFLGGHRTLGSEAGATRKNVGAHIGSSKSVLSWRDAATMGEKACADERRRWRGGHAPEEEQGTWCLVGDERREQGGEDQADGQEEREDIGTRVETKCSLCSKSGVVSDGSGCCTCSRQMLSINPTTPLQWI